MQNQGITLIKNTIHDNSMVSLKLFSKETKIKLALKNKWKKCTLTSEEIRMDEKWEKWKKN